MSEQTQQLVDTIRSRLALTVRRVSLADAAFGVVVTAAIAILLWTLATAIETLFWLPIGARAVLLIAALLGSIGVFSLLAARPLLRLAKILPPHPDGVIARRIGTSYPQVGDRLTNMLDLSEGRASDAPPEFVDGAVSMLGHQVLPVQFEQVEDFGRARRAARFSAVPAVMLVLFLVAAPGSFFGASHRLVSVGTAFERPAPYTLTVMPGDVEVIRGAELETVVRAEGRRLPESITLALKRGDEEHVERLELTSDSSGQFRHSIANVRQPLRYRAEAADVSSPWYEVRVLERPVMRGLQVRLDYPSYSGLASRRLEPNVGDVTALAGTRISVNVGVGAQQLEAAYLVFEDGTQVPLALDGDQAASTFTLRGKGSYRVTLRGQDGIENAEPITYQLDVIPDELPTVVLTSPEPAFDLDRSLAVPLGARIHDDFGFSDVALHYRLAESRYKAPSDTFSVLDLPLDSGGAPDQHIAYEWLLAETTTLDPVPGDVVEYFVRVRDNDSWAGYKAASSELHKLAVPSLAERYAQLDESQETVEQDIEEILQEAEAVRTQFDALRNELRQNQEGSWDEKRQLEQIQSRQKEVESRVEELGQQIDEMTQDMRTNRLVSSETMEMYEELRKVVEEINSPELREALERLQQAVENLDLQQLQESLGDVEFNEQQYRERLERTLELFKKMRVQQRLDEAARRAEEMAERQRDLAERTEALMQNERGEDHSESAAEDEQSERQDPESSDEGTRASEEETSAGETDEGREAGEEPEASDENQEHPSADEPSSEPSSEAEPSAEDLALEQDRARQEAEDLMKSLEEAAEQMRELRSGTQEQMEQLLEESKQQQVPRQMEQNADQLRQQQLEEAQQGQQQMSQTLQQMSDMIRQMQESMSGMAMNVNIAGIRQALEDVLTLSQNQEAARQGVQGAAPESPRLREYAQEQVRLGEGLSIVADSLQRLSREIPQMSRTVQQFTGDALREMSEATSALADRSARTGAMHQQSAMMHLNELALVLADLLSQMMSGGGGGGMQSMQQMLQQMQQMAGQQEQLNQQIQQFLNDMQGNRLASDAQQRLQQMADQQSSIRKQLREMSRNSEARGKLLGDLSRIADQMEETIEELRAAQADRQTIERQQQILTRLLDAQKSLRERGREERREGQSADDVLRDGPSSLPPTDAAEQLRRDLIRALEAGYAPEYQELIKRYFELLQQQSAPAPVNEEN